MKNLIHPIVLAVVFGLFGPSQFGEAQQPYRSPYGQPPARQRGVLLLRNGQVLMGDIAQIEDRYSIVVARGEVRIHRREVECVCRDLEEAYNHRRLQTEFDSIQDHLDLAEWCRNNGLLTHASEELRIAASLDPNHPLIPLVDRKIRMAIEQQTMPAERYPVASVGDRDVSVDELDRMVRGMPSGAVEMFTQTIQPMMVNTCATAGCHGPASEDTFRLLRVSAGQSASRRLTQRNLHAVIKLIRWDDPANSPLLTVPIQPHGGRAMPIFSDKQMDQYQQLVRWVHVVALGKRVELERRPKNVVAASHEQRSADSAVVPAGFEVPLEEAQEALPRGNGVLSALGVAPSEDGTPRKGANRARAGLRESSEAQVPGSLGEEGATRIRRSVPASSLAVPGAAADPFDPAVFNRRYVPQPPTPPSDAQELGQTISPDAKASRK